MQQRGLNASLFSVNAVLPVDWEMILTSVRRTGRLVVLDDSKSINRSCHHLAIAVSQKCPTDRVRLVTRTPSDEGIRPNADQFVIDHESIISQLGLGQDTPVAPTSTARF